MLTGFTNNCLKNKLIVLSQVMLQTEIRHYLPTILPINQTYDTPDAAHYRQATVLFLNKFMQRKSGIY